MCFVLLFSRRYRVKESSSSSHHRPSRGHFVDREEFLPSSDRCLPGMNEALTGPLKCPLPGHNGSKNDYTHIWERPLPIPNEVHIVSNSNTNTTGTGSVSYWLVASLKKKTLSGRYQTWRRSASDHSICYNLQRAPSPPGDENARAGDSSMSNPSRIEGHRRRCQTCYEIEPEETMAWLTVATHRALQYTKTVALWKHSIDRAVKLRGLHAEPFKTWFLLKRFLSSKQRMIFKCRYIDPTSKVFLFVVRVSTFVRNRALSMDPLALHVRNEL